MSERALVLAEIEQSNTPWTRMRTYYRADVVDFHSAAERREIFLYERSESLSVRKHARVRNEALAAVILTTLSLFAHYVEHLPYRLFLADSLFADYELAFGIDVHYGADVEH